MAYLRLTNETDRDTASEMAQHHNAVFICPCGGAIGIDLLGLKDNGDIDIAVTMRHPNCPHGCQVSNIEFADAQFSDIICLELHQQQPCWKMLAIYDIANASSRPAMSN